MVILGLGIIHCINLDWFVYPSTKELNVILDDISISGIDRQLRASELLKNKTVYLNEITVKTTVNGEEMFNSTLELVYSNVFSERDGEKRFKRYIRH